jgi:four helix bundle protein
MPMDYIYEKLQAWQDSVNFSNQVITLLGETSENWKNRDIVERAETSSANIALAIARAKCSRTRNDIIQQLYLSRRALYETMTFIEIFRKNKWISNKQYAIVRTESKRISRSLVDMMRGMNLFPNITGKASNS